jgi:hypothetical protein
MRQKKCNTFASGLSGRYNAKLMAAAITPETTFC